jgi:hypothetical protein
VALVGASFWKDFDFLPIIIPDSRFESAPQDPQVEREQPSRKKKERKHSQTADFLLRDLLQRSRQIIR